MRVLELAEFAVPRPGSFVPAVGSVLEAARDRGWSGELLLGESSRGLSWIGDLEKRGIQPRFAPPGLRRDLVGWLEGIVGESREPTAIHTHFTRFDTVAWRASRGRDTAGVFWHLHTVLARSPAVIASNLIRFGAIARGIELIFCPSEDLAAQLRRRLAPASKLRVVHNAIDTERFRPPTRDQQAAARRGLGFADGTVVLLHHGREWRVKGGDVFLGALRALADRGVDAVGLCIAGGEPARSQAVSLGISDRLRLVDPVDDVRELLAASDLMIAPSRGDTSPYAVLEALACGVPVVASDISGHRVFAESVVTCTVAPNEVEPMTDAVTAELAKDPARRSTEAAEAHEAMRARFSLRSWSEPILDAFEERLGSSP